MSGDDLVPGAPMSRLLENYWKWFAAGALAVVAFALGLWGFDHQPTAPGEDRSLLDNVYRSLQLFWLEYGSALEPASWQLDAARLLAPAALLVTAASVLVAIFRERLQLLGLGRQRERLVICGLGRKGLLLARAFKKRGCLVVVIEKDEQNARVQTCRDEGMPVVIGDVTDPAVLRRARVDRAAQVIAVCGRDGVNADVAAHARDLVAESLTHAGLLTAFVHVVDLELCNLLRSQVAAADRPDSYRLELFNVFEIGAREWLSEHPPFGKMHEQRDGRPHLLVVGAGQLGMSLVVGAARRWLTLHAASGRRPRITIVDREAERRKKSLLLRFPMLEDVCDLVPVTIDVTWPEFEESAFLRGWDGRSDVTAIYVCLDDDARGVAAALGLLDHVRDDDVSIVVRTEEEAGLAGVVQGLENVRVFPLLDRTCTPEMLLGETPSEMLARGMHEKYVRHEREAGRTTADNPVLVDWRDLPEGLKESNRRQADHVGIKLGAVGCGLAPLTDGGADRVVFSSAEVELLAEMEHERWLGERLFEGWTHAPAPKSIERRTSPDLVRWEDLDEGAREKDRAAVRGLPDLLRAAGFGIHRLERKDRDGEHA